MRVMIPPTATRHCRRRFASTSYRLRLRRSTTAVSFLCLNFSDSPPFRTLGNLVAFGLVLTFLLTFTFLPALMTWLPPQPALRRITFERAMARLGGFVVMRHKLILCAGLVIAVTCAWGTRQLTFDDRFSQYFSERFAFRQATDILEDRLTGLTVLEFSLPAGPEGGAAKTGIPGRCRPVRDLVTPTARDGRAVERDGRGAPSGRADSRSRDRRRPARNA